MLVYLSTPFSFVNSNFGHVLLNQVRFSRSARLPLWKYGLRCLPYGYGNGVGFIRSRTFRPKSITRTVFSIINCLRFFFFCVSFRVFFPSRFALFLEFSFLQFARLSSGWSIIIGMTSCGRSHSRADVPADRPRTWFTHAPLRIFQWWSDAILSSERCLRWRSQSGWDPSTTGKSPGSANAS